MAIGTKTLKIIVTATATRAEKVFKKLKAGMKSVASAGARIGAGIAAGFSVATVAFAAFTSRILNTQDALKKTAQKLGATTEELVSLRKAAEFSGIATNTMDMGLQRMTRRLSEAAQGAGEAKGAIEELGLNAQELAAAGPAEALKTITNALNGVENQADKVRLAFKFFDSEGVAFVNLTAAALERGKKEAKLFGLAMDNVSADRVVEINDNISTIKNALSGFGTQVIANLTTPFLKASEAVKGLAESGSLKLWAAQTALAMVKAFQGVTMTIGFVVESLILAGRWLNVLRQGSATLVGAFASIRLQGLEADLRGAKEGLEELKASGEQVSGSWQLDQVQTLTTAIAKTKALADSSVDVYDGAVDAANELAAKQGSAFTATDKVINSLQQTETELQASVNAQEKLAENTVISTEQMTTLANETGRAASNMAKLVTLSGGLKIPSGQRVITGSGLDLSVRTEGD